LPYLKLHRFLINIFNFVILQKKLNEADITSI
jgi:hypothetical protein